MSDIITEKNVFLFWSMVENAIKTTDLSVYGCVSYFHDFDEVDKLYTRFEDHNGDGDDEISISLANLASKYMTESFFRKFEITESAIKRRKTFGKIPKIRQIDVSEYVINKVAEICKASNCDTDYAIRSLIDGGGIVERSITPESELIAIRVSDLLDEKIGKRMADIEMTMGIINEGKDIF